MVGFWIVLGKGFGFWGNGRRTMGYFGVFVLWEDEGKGVSNARWDKFWCDRYSKCFLLIMYEKIFFFFLGSFTVWEVLIVQMLMILIFQQGGGDNFIFLHPPTPKKRKRNRALYQNLTSLHLYFSFIPFMSFKIQSTNYVLWLELL